MTQLNFDSDKLRIRVCVGMQCSMDGGGNVLGRALQQALTDEGVIDQVEMYSAHCLGECPDGPCVRVGTSRFYHMHVEDVPALVRDEILPRLNK